MIRARALRCGLVVAAVLLVSPAGAQSQSEQKPASVTPASVTQAPPVCIYESKSYSEGAYVCARTSLMLTCALDGAKATWKLATDKDLNDKCAAPVVRTFAPAQRARWYRRNIRREIAPAADSSAKCFNFNGKRYCE